MPHGLCGMYMPHKDLRYMWRGFYVRLLHVTCRWPMEFVIFRNYGRSIELWCIAQWQSSPIRRWNSQGSNSGTYCSLMNSSTQKSKSVYCPWSSWHLDDLWSSWCIVAMEDSKIHCASQSFYWMHCRCSSWHADASWSSWTLGTMEDALPGFATCRWRMEFVMYSNYERFKETLAV